MPVKYMGLNSIVAFDNFDKYLILVIYSFGIS